MRTFCWKQKGKEEKLKSFQAVEFTTVCVAKHGAFNSPNQYSREGARLCKLRGFPPFFPAPQRRPIRRDETGDRIWALKPISVHASSSNPESIIVWPSWITAIAGAFPIRRNYMKYNRNNGRCVRGKKRRRRLRRFILHPPRHGANKSDHSVSGSRRGLRVNGLCLVGWR